MKKFLCFFSVASTTWLAWLLTIRAPLLPFIIFFSSENIFIYFFFLYEKKKECRKICLWCAVFFAGAHIMLSTYSHAKQRMKVGHVRGAYNKNGKDCGRRKLM